MIRGGIDQVMGYQLTPMLVVLAYCGALFWALRRSIVPALIVNIVSGTAVALYVFTAPGRSMANLDIDMLLGVFELAVLGATGAALAGTRIPVWIVWAGFGINFVFAATMTAVLLTFKMTRLF